MPSGKVISTILAYLDSDHAKEGLDEDKQENLLVARQCLEEAYGTGSGEHHEELFKLLCSSGERVISKEDKEFAVKKKEEGNEFMKQDDFVKAVEAYTQAIAKDPEGAVYYCNRAAAYTSLGNHKQAIVDCESALKIDSNYGKAYGRMGLAYMNEQNYAKAKDAYEKALSLEPSNASYKTNLDTAVSKIGSGNSGTGAATGGGGFGIPGLGNLDLGSLLSNPAVMGMAQNLMSNPQVQNMFSGMMGGGSAQQNTGGGAPETAQTPTNMDTTAPSTGLESAQGDTGTGSTGVLPGNLDFNSILSATQNIAQQLNQQNPELASQLRQQFQEGNNQPPSDKTS